MTLPSPFSQQNQQVKAPAAKNSRFVHNDEPKQHNQAPRNFISFCKYCQIGFPNDTELFQHRRAHTKCPYDDCKFNANEVTVSNHIQRVHLKPNSLVKIEDLTTPEQIEKWREERRKRYPTTQNVILRQQIQEEKVKRGEKLNDSRKRFGDHQQRDFVKNMGNQKGKNLKDKGKGRHKPQRQRQLQRDTQSKNERATIVSGSSDKTVNATVASNLGKITVSATVANGGAAPNKVVKQPLPIRSLDLDSSSDEEIRALPRFKGTSTMKDYHTVDTIIREKPALTLLGMYGSDSEDESSSDNEMAAETDPKVEEIPEVPEEISKQAEIDPQMDDNERQVDSQVSKDDQEEVAPSSQPSENDEGPEEVPIVKHQENDLQDQKPPDDSPSKSRKRKRNGTKNEKEQIQKKVVRRSGLDYSKLRNKSVNPFLEKLLERDIVHERNVLFQCVNFVVKSDFFGIGRTEPKEPDANLD